MGSWFSNLHIRRTDTAFLDMKGERPALRPFELTKVQLRDGRWAYHYHDPGFRIPPRVDEGLPIMKQMRMKSEREILDIAVVLVLDKNPEGQTGWYVWQFYDSKESYIYQYNKRWEKHRSRCAPGDCTPELRREDYD